MPWLKSDADVIEQLDSSLVDEEFDLFAGDVLAEAEILDRELVLAVGGKVVRDQHVRRESERQPFDVLILGRIARRDVIRRSRRFPVTDGHSGDPRRGRGVGFQQCRRNRQRAGDVIETSRRIIRREQGRRIDLDVEQIANDIGIFRSVEPMENDGARVGMTGGLTVDFGFQPVPKSFVFFQRTAVSFPAEASRRRAVCG